MKIKISFPVSGIEGDLVAYDADGKQVSLQRMEWTPYFYDKEAKLPVLFAVVVDRNGKDVARSALVVSGGQGRLTLADRKTPVEPCVDSGEPTRRQLRASSEVPKQ